MTPAVNIILPTIRFLPVTRDIIYHLIGAVEDAEDIHLTIADGQEDDHKKEIILARAERLAKDGKFTYIGLKDPTQRVFLAAQLETEWILPLSDDDPYSINLIRGTCGVSRTVSSETMAIVPYAYLSYSPAQFNLFRLQDIEEAKQGARLLSLYRQAHLNGILTWSMIRRKPFLEWLECLRTKAICPTYADQLLVSHLAMKGHIVASKEESFYAKDQRDWHDPVRAIIKDSGSYGEKHLTLFHEIFWISDLFALLRSHGLEDRALPSLTFRAVALLQGGVAVFENRLRVLGIEQSGYSREAYTVVTKLAALAATLAEKPLDEHLRFFTQVQSIAAELQTMPDGAHTVDAHLHYEAIECTAGPTDAMSPAVSIVIPCYNQAQYLPEAVESVASQTYRDWECIIVNDGSSDNTSEVARRLMAQHPDKRIRLIEKPNGGLSDARNAGIKTSTARYILPLDADDRLAPTMLEKTVALLESQPQTGVAYTYIQHFGDQTDIWRTGPFTLETELRDNRIPYCSLYRRDLFNTVGGYNTNLNAYEDWDFWLGALERGWTGALIPEPLFLYRKRANSMLGEANTRREQLCARIRANHPRLFGGPSVHPARVLMVCTHFPPSVGGLETVAAQLGKSLIAKGYEVHVATERSEKREFKEYCGITIHSLDPVPLPEQRLPQAVQQLRELILSGRYDACILLADPRNWIFWSLEGFDVPEHTRIIAQPLINVEGFARWRDNRNFRTRLAQILKRVHSVVAISTGGAIVQYLTEEGIPYVYIPNAVEREKGSDDFRARHGIPEAVPLLLHIANLWPVKNHLGLMDALSTMDGDWRLVIIGHSSGDSQYDRQVRDAVQRDPRFMLIPGLSRHEVSAALDTADILLLASHGEVAPVTVLEAMSHATPWLATPQCGGVHDNAGGLIVPLEQFPSALSWLLKDRQTLDRLGQAGYRHWSERFGWDTVISAWHSLIQTGASSATFEIPALIGEEMQRIRDGMPQSLRGGFTTPASASAVDPPLVSVIVPTCNRLVSVRTTLDTIVGQTYPNLEIIIVNDGEADLQELVNAYRPQRPVTYVVHDRNRGTGASRNTGLKLARGKYIAYLDDDDRYLPEHIAVLASALDAHQDHVAAYSLASEVTQIERDGRCEPLRRQVTYNRPFDPHQMLVANYIPNLCLMHRRSACEKIGGYDEELTMLEDWEFLIRLSRMGEFVYIPKVTAEYYVNIGSSHRNRVGEQAISITRAIYERYIEYAMPAVRQAQQSYLERLSAVVHRLDGNPQASERVEEVAALARQAEQHIIEGDLAAARQRLDQALEIRPGEPQLMVMLGNVLLRLGDIEAARHEFTKATILHPQCAPAHADLAAVLLHLGRTAEAEASACKTIKLDPTNVSALKVLGRICLDTERYQEAVQAYATILDHASDDIDTLILVGNCYAESGRFEQARSFYRKVLALDPSNAVAAENVAEVDRLLAASDGTAPEPLASAVFEGGPSVSIVIVTYNSASTIRACLDSVLKASRSATDLIVVDNLSTDETRSILREYQGRIATILNHDNVGFSAACNQGIRASTGEYIVLLNPDTVVTPGWLDRLIAHIGPSVGAVGPVSDYAAELQNIDRNLPDGAPKRMELPEVTDLLGRANHGKAKETKLLTGFCMMIPRKVLDEVGLLDENLFLGNDDLDLSWRLRLKGYKLVVATDTFIHHQGQVSFKSEAETKTSRLVQESTDRLYVKLEAHYGPGNVPSPMELWGIDWFKPTKKSEVRSQKFEVPLAPRPSPLTSIIILTHNALAHTKKCLASIGAHTVEPHELIIVDNASTDGTLDYLRDYTADHYNVRVVANRTNQGFAAGNNQGLALARGDYLLLLNNDTIVTEGWLTRMLRIFEAHPDVGIVGPMSNYALDPQLVRGTSYKGPEGLAAFAAGWAQRHDGQSREATRVIGFCLLMRKEVVAHIGGLDERFGSGNFEDDDFSIRAFQVGFRARIALDAFVHHTGSQTFKAAKIDYRQSLMRNWELFKRKWNIPADAPYEKGYQFPPRAALNESLSVPLPDVGTDHRCGGDGRWWREIGEDRGRCEPVVNGEPPISAIIMPNGHGIAPLWSSLVQHTNQPLAITISPSTGNGGGYAPPPQPSCPDGWQIGTVDVPAVQLLNRLLQSAGDQPVILLSGEVVVTPGWLKRLVTVCDRNPHLAMVGPAMNDGLVPQQVKADYRGTGKALRQFGVRRAHQYGKQLAATESLAPSCMVFNPSVCRSIGPLRDDLDLAASLTDYFARIKQAGHTLAVALGAYVHCE